MTNKLQLTLKYAFAMEVFFTIICVLLVAIEYFIGSGTLTIKGTLYCMVVFQVPVAVLAIRHWMRLNKDSLIN